jgi:putative FmdB family regulatory protein
MPIYTYRCDACGVQFDKRQSFSDKPLTRCPECNGNVRRLLQPPGIVFKGSGWYITDSRRSSSASMPAKSKDNTSSSTSSSESSSQSPAEE